MNYTEGTHTNGKYLLSQRHRSVIIEYCYAYSWIGA